VLLALCKHIGKRFYGLKLAKSEKEEKHQGKPHLDHLCEACAMRKCKNRNKSNADDELSAAFKRINLKKK